jgi:hypothetical protein
MGTADSLPCLGRPSGELQYQLAPTVEWLVVTVAHQADGRL